MESFKPASEEPGPDANRRFGEGFRQFTDQWWCEFSRFPGFVYTVGLTALVLGAGHAFTSLPNAGLAAVALPVQWIPQFHTMGRALPTFKGEHCAAIAIAVRRGGWRSLTQARPLHALALDLRTIEWDRWNAPETYERRGPDRRIERRRDYEPGPEIGPGLRTHMQAYTQQFWKDGR